MEGKASREIKGYNVAFEGLASKEESTLGSGSKREDGVILGELGKAVVG